MSCFQFNKDYIINYQQYRKIDVETTTPFLQAWAYLFEMDYILRREKIPIHFVRKYKLRNIRAWSDCFTAVMSRICTVSSFLVFRKRFTCSSLMVDHMKYDGKGSVQMNWFRGEVTKTNVLTYDRADRGNFTFRSVCQEFCQALKRTDLHTPAWCEMLKNLLEDAIFHFTFVKTKRYLFDDSLIKIIEVPSIFSSIISSLGELQPSQKLSFVIRL